MFNRWAGSGQPTRVFTADPDGKTLRLLSAAKASHWTWRDPEHVLIWDGAYRLYKDDGAGKPIATVWQAPNGHHTFHQPWIGHGRHRRRVGRNNRGLESTRGRSV